MAEKETLALGRDVPTDSAAPLAEVFTMSYRRLAMQLYGVVGNLAEAEDLVQEAFVRAAAAGTRFQRVDNPEAWLRRTAINLHRKRWRKIRNYRSDPAPARGATGGPAGSGRAPRRDRGAAPAAGGATGGGRAAPPRRPAGGGDRRSARSPRGHRQVTPDARPRSARRPVVGGGGHE